MSQYPIWSKSRNCLWSWKCPHFTFNYWTAHRLDWWCLPFSWEKVGKRLDSVGLSPSCRNIWEMIAKFAAEIIIYSQKDNLHSTYGQLGRSRICDWFFLPHSSEGIGYYDVCWRTHLMLVKEIHLRKRKLVPVFSWRASRYSLWCQQGQKIPNGECWAYSSFQVRSLFGSSLSTPNSRDD